MNEKFDYFVAGQKDCNEGNEAKQDMPDAYYSGYGFQYETEQILTHNSEIEDEA